MLIWNGTEYVRFGGPLPTPKTSANVGRIVRDYISTQNNNAREFNLLIERTRMLYKRMMDVAFAPILELPEWAKIENCEER